MALKEGRGLVKTASPPSCTYEDVIDMMGGLGKFQFIQIGLCFLCILFSCVMSLGFVFIGYTPHHICNSVNHTEILSRYGLDNDSTATVSYGSCKIVIYSNQSGQLTDIDSLSCPHGRNFTGGKHLTLVSQWDLVCESAGMAELSQTLFVGGQIVGAIFLNPLPDHFGRKSFILINVLICTIVEFSIAFAPNIYTVWCLLFVEGIFYLPFDSNILILGMEFLRPRDREKYSIGDCNVWIFFMLIVDLLGYLLQDVGWRYFQAAGAMTGLLLILHPFFLCESPRWLATKNRTAEALVILKKVCRQNGLDFLPVKEKFMEHVRSMHCNPEKPICLSSGNQDNDDIEVKVDKKTSYTVLSLLRHWYTLVPLVVVMFIWIIHNMTYYGIYMASSSFSGDRFVNFAILSLVEIPSNLVILYLFRRMGRLTVIKIFMLMAATCLLVSSVILYLDVVGILSSVLFVVGKFAITASYNVVYTYTPEIIPTVVRSSAFSSCLCMARIGSLMAPYFRPLYDMYSWVPGVIFSSMCVIGFLLLPLLPETKDRILPNGIEEMKEWMKEGKKTDNVKETFSDEERSTVS